MLESERSSSFLSGGIGCYGGTEKLADVGGDSESQMMISNILPEYSKWRSVEIIVPVPHVLAIVKFNFLFSNPASLRARAGIARMP